MDGVVGRAHLQTHGAHHPRVRVVRAVVARVNLARVVPPQAHLNHVIGYGYHTALVASRARVVAASRVRVDQKDPNQRVESPQRAVHLPPLGVMMDGGVSLLTAHPMISLSNSLISPPCFHFVYSLHSLLK